MIVKALKPHDLLRFLKITSTYTFLSDFKTIVGDHLNINIPEKFKDWFNTYSSRISGVMTIDQLQQFFQDFVSRQFGSLMGQDRQIAKRVLYRPA